MGISTEATKGSLEELEQKVEGQEPTKEETPKQDDNPETNG